MRFTQDVLRTNSIVAIELCELHLSGNVKFALQQFHQTENCWCKVLPTHILPTFLLSETMTFVLKNVSAIVCAVDLAST